MSEKSLEEKKKEFLEKYKELRDEYQLDFATIPQFVPLQPGLFGITNITDLFDISNMDKESFIPKANESIQKDN